MALPTFIIVGAMKSGTSSIYEYLDLHPAITMSRKKELDFFIEERNWPRGTKWYQRQFSGKTTLRGEASPNYTKRHLFAGVPERIQTVLGRPKLIYILRNPIGRIRSHFQHNLARGREVGTIDSALATLTGNGYLDTSRYGWQLEAYLDVFSRDDVLVTTLERLNSSPREAVAEVLEFLGLDGNFDHPKLGRSFHSSAGKTLPNALTRPLRKTEVGSKLLSPLLSKLEQPLPKVEVSDALRTRLLDELEPDLQRLRQLTGQTFEEWTL